jgi:hypothetical protein
VIRRAIVLLLLSTLLACGKDAPPATATAAPKPAVPAVVPQSDADGDNLLSLAYGGAVVSRGGEFDLENSAAHTIDGLMHTKWTAAPGSAAETLVYSLLAPARIQRVGISTAASTTLTITSLKNVSSSGASAANDSSA